MSQYLFAYGTLQHGHAPSEIAVAVERLRPVGRGFVHGVLYDLGGYPGAALDPQSMGRIAGTVLELPEDASVLRALDAYEGFDPEAPGTSEFVRERQSVELSGGGKVECWFYRYNRPLGGARAIEGGAWRRSAASSKQANG